LTNSTNEPIGRLRPPSQLDLDAFMTAIKRRDTSAVIAFWSDESPIIRWPKYPEEATLEDKRFLDDCCVTWRDMMTQEEH